MNQRIDHEHFKLHSLEHTIPEWAALYQVSEGHIVNLSGKLKVKTKHVPGIHDDYILKNHIGKTIVEIAKELNWAHSNVKALCKKLGVTPKSQPPPKKVAKPKKIQREIKIEKIDFFVPKKKKPVQKVEDHIINIIPNTYEAHRDFLDRFIEVMEQEPPIDRQKQKHRKGVYNQGNSYVKLMEKYSDI